MIVVRPIGVKNRHHRKVIASPAPDSYRDSWDVAISHDEEKNYHLARLPHPAPPESSGLGAGLAMTF